MDNNPRSNRSNKNHPDALELDFNEDFKRAYDLLENSNRFVFITGKAGTGKSTLLKYFVRSTIKKVVLLAPTGVAALNIGGVTIHSFFKFPPRPITDADIRYYPELEIYKIIETIVIDEISMVRADLLDAIDKFMRLNGKYPLKPFGGTQVIFFGDLYQLSPIVANEEEARLFGTYYESPWFFDSKVIQEIDLEIIELSKVYRQKDKSFIDILDAIRTNKVDNSTLAIINEQYTNHIRDEEFITLTCTNGRAKGINFRKLSLLPLPEYIYLGTIEGEFPIKTLPTDIELRLRKDARVMFIKNDLHKRWVNGTIGKICNLDDKSVRVEIISEGNQYAYEVEQETWEILKYKFNPEIRSINTEVIGSFKQYPLKLAWAVTIHKSQGLTFNNLIIDFERGAFAYGQTYVALSRCTSLEGITLKQPIRHSDIKVDIVVTKYFEGLQLARPEHDVQLQEEKVILSKISGSAKESRLM
jgi:ATP-dependent DNA helicase PIF1